MENDEFLLSFDDLADIGEIDRMSEEELNAYLLAAGFTPERIEASRLRIMKFLEEKLKEIENGTKKS